MVELAPEGAVASGATNLVFNANIGKKIATSLQKLFSKKYTFVSKRSPFQYLTSRPESEGCKGFLDNPLLPVQGSCALVLQFKILVVAGHGPARGQLAQSCKKCGSLPILRFGQNR